MGLLVALAAVAVALFVVLSGSDDDEGGGGSTTATTTTAEPAFEVIEIASGGPVGGVRQLSYDQGDRIRIRVIPEPGVEEIHFHGYEIEKETDGAKPVVFDFPAEITGGFEIEAHSHDGDFQIASVKVEP